MNPDLHFSNATDEWATPQHVFDALNAMYGPFDLDAAATAKNTKVPGAFLTIEEDALSQPWHGRSYCNPPFSKVARFIEHAIREVDAGRAEVVVLLVPARTDTVWFREAYEHADEVRALSGRLRFGNATDPAPFPSCVIVLRPHRRHTWTLTGTTRYTMPKRHGTRPRWYTIKASALPGTTTAGET